MLKKCLLHYLTKDRMPAHPYTQPLLEDMDHNLQIGDVILAPDISKVTKSSYKEHFWSKKICSYKIDDNDPVRKHLTPEDNIIPCKDNSISELENMKLNSIQVLKPALVSKWKIVYTYVSKENPDITITLYFNPATGESGYLYLPVTEWIHSSTEWKAESFSNYNGKRPMKYIL